MTFSELANDLLDGFKSRLRKPYLSAYIIAVLIFNWEAVLVLINSTQPIETRLHYIHSEYLDLYSYILIPLLSALVFLLGSDYIMWGLEYLTARGVKWRSEIRHEKAMDQSERNINLNRRKLEEQQSLNEYKERKDLNDRIEILQKENNELKEQYSDLIDELGKLKIVDLALKELTKHFGLTTFVSVFQEFGEMSHSDINYVFSGFLSSGQRSIDIPNSVYISPETKKYLSHKEKNTYSLTKKGIVALEVFKNLRENTLEK